MFFRRVAKGIHHRAVEVTINFPSRPWSDSNSFRVHHPLFNFCVGMNFSLFDDRFSEQRNNLSSSVIGQLRRRFIYVSRARAFDSSKFRSTFLMRPLYMLKRDSMSGKEKPLQSIFTYRSEKVRNKLRNGRMCAYNLPFCEINHRQLQTIMH